MIKFHCPHCNHRLGAREDYAGKQVRCTKCQQIISVPEQSEEAKEGQQKLIKYRCPNCNQKLGVPLAYAGRRVRCSKCQEVSVVPRVQEEAKASEGVPEEPRADEMFEEGPGDIFSDGALTEQLLEAEQSAPVVDKTPRSVGVSGPGDRCSTCGTVVVPGSEICTICGQKLSVSEEKEVSGKGNIGISLGAGVGFAVLGVIAWVILASVVGHGWMNIMVMAIGPLAGLGLTVFTDKRSAGIGWLAVLIGFFGIVTGKFLIAKYVVMPELMPKFQEVMDMGLAELESDAVSDDMVRDIVKDPNLMFGVALLELVDQNEIEEDLIREIAIWRFTGESRPELKTDLETAREKINERLESWSQEEKTEAAKVQYPRMIREFAGFFFNTGMATVIGFFVAFIAAFECLDVVWFPLGLYFAYRVGAGKD
jgi:DNA-directed RNA polymerase subunit M/transcription elongation factor TFIIS